MILKLYFQEEHTLDKLPIKRKCSPASTRVINLLLGRHGKAVAACFIAGRSASPKAQNSMVDQLDLIPQQLGMMVFSNICQSMVACLGISKSSVSRALQG